MCSSVTLQLVTMYSIVTVCCHSYLAASSPQEDCQWLSRSLQLHHIGWKRWPSASCLLPRQHRRFLRPWLQPRPHSESSLPLLPLQQSAVSYIWMRQTVTTQQHRVGVGDISSDVSYLCPSAICSILYDSATAGSLTTASSSFSLLQTGNDISNRKELFPWS